MLIPAFVSRIDAVGFDRQLECRLGGVFPVKLKLSGDIVKPTVNPTDIQMPGLEADRGMDEVIGIFIRRRARFAAGTKNRSDHDRRRTHGEKTSHQIVPFQKRAVSDLLPGARHVGPHRNRFATAP